MPHDEIETTPMSLATPTPARPLTARREAGRTIYRLPDRRRQHTGSTTAAPALRTFDAAIETERADWVRRWRATGREPFAHPAFGEIFADEGDRVVAVADRASGSLLPLRLRPIPGSTTHVDATGPYGYGGAYRQPGSRLPGGDFWRDLAAWGRAQSVVSVFSRMHLFADEVLPAPDQALVTRSVNYVRSVRMTDEALLSDVEHKVRKNVRRAQADGVTVRFTAGADGFEDFARIYAATMERRDAAAHYRFDDAFFEQIHRELAGSFVYAYAERDGVVVSCELVLHSDEHAYSFLGGTDAEAFSSRPNDLLKLEIARWCRAQGLSDFVLGGGATPGDGIERYKRAFAPSGAQTFRTLQLVLDPDTEAALSVGRARGFFPAYRGPLLDDVAVGA